MLIEADPTNLVSGGVLMQRPALSLVSTVGTGPFRGMFRRSGTLFSQYLVVSGESAYLVTRSGTATLLGSVPGTDMVSIDGSASRAIIVADGIAYSTNGVTLTAITMPDGRPVTSVVYIGGYFILTVRDSQRFYWIAPGETNPDALSFASAESAPDDIVGAIRLLDEVWIFGEQSTEVFQQTADADAPFQPIGGRLYEKGCANRDTLCVLDNSIFWVGNDLVVYRAGSGPLRVSDHSLEEKLRAANPAMLRAWGFAIEGHTIYSLRIATIGTYVYDIENSNWPRFKSHNSENWRAHVGAQIDGSLILAGDDTDGSLWRVDTFASSDGDDEMERVVTGGVAVIDAPVTCENLYINVAAGWADITGLASEPIVSMRFSDDGGNTWSPWFQESMGLQGQYKTAIAWQQLGIISAPGRLFTFRVTDPTLFRISYCRMNEYFA